MQQATVVEWNNGQGGKLGEDLARRYFYTLGYNPLEIIDVSDIKNYQKQDIDLILKCNNQDYSIEVKQDNVTYESLNLMIETVSNAELNKPGWLFTTQSDYIIIVQPNNQRLFVLGTKALKEYMKRNEKDFSSRTYTQETPLKNGQCYHSKAIKVPIKWLMDTCNVLLRVVDLKTYKTTYPILH